MLNTSLSIQSKLAWAVLAAGILASLVAGHLVKLNTQVNALRQFSLACDQVTLKIRERLGAYSLILRGGAGLFAASTNVSRQEWRAYVQKLHAEATVPGVQGIGFAKVIAQEQLAAHIAGIRAEGFPEYTVRPAGERAVYTSIIYLEPFRDRNLRAFGYDMFSEPVRHAAMEIARDSGEATLSGKVELVQETASDVQAGTLMYVPVYRIGAPLDSVERRRAALVGWTYSPYRMNDLMQGILRDWEDQEGRNIDMNIYDGLEAKPVALLYDGKLTYTPRADSLFYQQRTILFNGRPWLVEFDKIQKNLSVSYLPAWATLLAGFALSGLLSALVVSVVNTRARASRMAEDLTERIREHSEQLDGVFALSPDGFITFDRSFRIRYVSPSFTVMTGLKDHDLVGLDETAFSNLLATICVPNRRLSGIAALRHPQEPDNSSDTITSQDPKTRAEPAENPRQTIEILGARKRVLECGLRTADASTVSQILYFRDITRESEVDHMKSEFLSVAAHELRTPMTSIYGFAELLITRKFEEAERNDFLETIIRQSRLTISILNELLDLVRIEDRRGKDFTFTDIELRDLLQEIIAGFNPPAGRALPEQHYGNHPLWVRTDRAKLTQAVSNVLSNAYKYSPEGGAVKIEMPRLPRDEARSCIRIIDQGIGMTQNQLERVGERFYRADTSGRIPGTGLGMSIVKEIVSLLDGQIEIRSKIGEGTAVTIWLPRANINAALPPPPETPAYQCPEG